MHTFFLAVMIRGRVLLSAVARCSWINRALKVFGGLVFYGLAICALALLAAAEWWLREANRRNAERGPYGSQ